MRSSKFIIAILLLSQQTFALTESARKLVNFETKANAVSKRENKHFRMPHFEIPLSMLEVDFAERLSPKIREQLIFKKNGKDMVRWILNPEDTAWYLKVQEYFLAKGLKLEKKYHFTGYQTASRSYIVEDPDKKVQFSVKSSTNVTGGHWADKQQPVGEAIDSRLNADFLADIQEKLKFEHLVIMDEPAIIKAPAIDQAVVIRDLADLNVRSSGKIYVPGFSVLHEEWGREIASRNGSNNPYEFWTEHYIKAVGRALGEFAARTGLQFDSPHSQNFLVELDTAMKPTGRIVLRDLADLYIYKPMMETLNKDSKTYFEQFTQKGNILASIAAGFGPLHGNEAPSWVTADEYFYWKNDFFKEFEKTFSEVSGLSTMDFKNNHGEINGKYFGNKYVVKKSTETGAKYWKSMLQDQVPKGIFNCSYVLKK